MTAPSDELVERYAANFALNIETTTRLDMEDAPFGVVEFEPIDPARIVEAYAMLTEKAADYAGLTLECRGVVSWLNDNNHEVMIALDKIKDLGHIDSAMVALASEYSQISAEAIAVMETFAGLMRLKQHCAEEPAK